MNEELAQRDSDIARKMDIYEGERRLLLYCLGYCSRVYVYIYVYSTTTIGVPVRSEYALPP